MTTLSRYILSFLIISNSISSLSFANDEDKSIVPGTPTENNETLKGVLIYNVFLDTRRPFNPFEDSSYQKDSQEEN